MARKCDESMLFSCRGCDMVGGRVQ